MFCAPFTSLAIAREYADECGFTVGAQNFYPAPSGTFTGEISLGMLKEIGVRVVLAGHSERRAIFNETDAFINEKVKAGLAADMMVILCVGETSEERESKKTAAVIKKQMTGGLAGITEKSFNQNARLVVAYEPVWAISGGDPNKPKPIATQAQIEEAHGMIRSMLVKQFPNTFVPILYGGSANDKNAKEIFAMKDVDGALVGGASLCPDKFSAVINA